MIGKIIGAVAGERIAKHVSGVSGPGGAILGAGAATVLRRMGPIGMVAALVGAYGIKKFSERSKSKI